MLPRHRSSVLMSGNIGQTQHLPDLSRVYLSRRSRYDSNVRVRACARCGFQLAIATVRPVGRACSFERGFERLSGKRPIGGGASCMLQCAARPAQRCCSTRLCCFTAEVGAGREQRRPGQVKRILRATFSDLSEEERMRYSTKPDLQAALALEIELSGIRNVAAALSKDLSDRPEGAKGRRCGSTNCGDRTRAAFHHAPGSHSGADAPETNPRRVFVAFTDAPFHCYSRDARNRSLLAAFKRLETAEMLAVSSARALRCTCRIPAGSIKRCYFSDSLSPTAL